MNTNKWQPRISEPQYPTPVTEYQRLPCSKHTMYDGFSCWGNWDMSWWRHQMETFSALLALFAGNSPVTGEFPHKSQWRGALGFSLICTWINGWVTNREAGDLRRHRAHYDITVMRLIAIAGSNKLATCNIIIQISGSFCRSFETSQNNIFKHIIHPE